SVDQRRGCVTAMAPPGSPTRRSRLEPRGHVMIELTSGQAGTLIVSGLIGFPDSDPAPEDATTARNGYGALQPVPRSGLFRTASALHELQPRRCAAGNPISPRIRHRWRMTLQTRFTEAYGLTTPIAQAGMAFVGMTPSLAVAVSNAGALGSIGVGLMPAEALAQTIAAVRAGTDRPFNINFITIFTSQAHIDAVCAAGVAVVSFHWGHPSRAWIDQLHAAGVRVFEQVGSVEDARRAAGDGVDVVVAQGQEAGGHNYGTLPTFALVPLVVDAVAPALVRAAGGIAEGRGLAAALMLGADGAWVGTRLVASAESEAHDGYKSRVVAAEATDTVRTGIFGPEYPQFNPMRVLRNRVV